MSFISISNFTAELRLHQVIFSYSESFGEYLSVIVKPAAYFVEQRLHSFGIPQQYYLPEDGTI